MLLTKPSVVVSQMTYSVLNGMLNNTVTNSLIVHLIVWAQLLSAIFVSCI